MHIHYMENMETDAKNIIPSLNFILYIHISSRLLFGENHFWECRLNPEPRITTIILTSHSHYNNKIFILCKKKKIICGLERYTHTV